MYAAKATGTSVIELIDTLWNVNFGDYRVNDSVYNELIDTLWNVNYYGVTRCTDKRQGELIDTLWNVNWLFYTS